MLKTSLDNDDEMIISYVDNPSYVDLVRGTLRGIRWYYSPRMTQNYSFPRDFLLDVRRHFQLDVPCDLVNLTVFTLVFVLGRFVFKHLLLKVTKQTIQLLIRGFLSFKQTNNLIVILS